MGRKPKSQQPQAKQKDKPRKRREAVIVARADRCPRCGEENQIMLRHSYYGGKRRYLCVSERCKQSSITGKGRQFVVMPR